MGISETIEHIWIKIKMPNPSQEPSVSSKAPNKDLEGMDVLWTFKIKKESKNSVHMGISKTSDHIWIKIKIPNLSQEHPVSSKAPNKDIKDIDILWAFSIKIECQIV